MIRAYLRVSTQEQAASDRTSLDQQKQRCLGAAMMRGSVESDVVFYTDAGVSGGIQLCKRPAGSKMLAEVKEGDTLIASKLDRMFRSCEDALIVTREMKERGVSVILTDCGSDPVNGDGAGKFFFTIMAGAAEFEKDRIHQRMMEGKNGKRNRGGHIGGDAPYGFRIVGTGRDSRLVEDVGEKAIIKVASELSQNRSPYRVCLELERRGLKNRAGGLFQPVQIQRMVSRIRAEAAE